MILIAHRGNLRGPTPSLENDPAYLTKALEAGFDIEVDVWNHEGNIFLGHDGPQYRLQDLALLKNKRSWCHAKNIQALKILNDMGCHCFFHGSDDVVLTSNKYLWVHSKTLLVPGCISVLPELGHRGDLAQVAGICSDYVANLDYI